MLFRRQLVKASQAWLHGEVVSTEPLSTKAFANLSAGTFARARKMRGEACA